MAGVAVEDGVDCVLLFVVGMLYAAGRMFLPCDLTEAVAGAFFRATVCGEPMLLLGMIRRIILSLGELVEVRKV